MISAECPLCHGKRLRARGAVGDVRRSRHRRSRRACPLLAAWCPSCRDARRQDEAREAASREGHRRAAHRRGPASRASPCCSTSVSATSRSDRSTPTLSPGELQRLRLATQVRSNLFGVVYVLDEPSAGLHPADTEALLAALERLKAAGNSLFVVEHELDVIRARRLDRGRRARRRRARRPRPLQRPVPPGCKRWRNRRPGATSSASSASPRRTPRTARGWLDCTASRATTCTASTSRFPLGVFTTVTGVSGSGKSSLVSQALVELAVRTLGHERPPPTNRGVVDRGAPAASTGGHIVGGHGAAQAAGARRPEADRPHAALEPRHLHRPLRPRPQALRRDPRGARGRRYDAGRFSFNVAKGRCETCEGEGFVMVELLFLPSVYAPCPTCHGARYNAKTLEITLPRQDPSPTSSAMTVDAAWEFFADEPPVFRPLDRAARGRPRLPAPRPAGDRALRRRSAAHQARDRAAARPARRTRSTSSTSPPPACIRPTSRGS